MKNTTFRRLFACLLALCLILSLLPELGVTARAADGAPEALDPVQPIWAPALPDKNSETRHQVCTALSAQALAYYTGSNTYENLAALPGAASSYDSYTACQNNQLFNALQSLMSSTHTYQTSYSGTSAGSLAYYWARTDSVDGSSTYVMFYCDEDGSIGSMQREHIWPKSRASYYQKNGGSDLHHLRPSYGSLNSAKSNHRFGNIVGKYASYNSGQVNGKTCYWTYSAGDLFECKDDVKGDVARILLYVYTRWGQPNLYTDVSSANLPAMDSDDSQNTGEPAIESLETLLEWCREDPVDTWEMQRNDLIQQVQGNRNVFIDYPELAWLMFGEEIPAGMQTPSSAGCSHQWTETGRTEATCTTDGEITYTCSLCGVVYTEAIPALGHLDQDGDGVCDRCGENLGAYVLSTALPQGAKALIYYPNGQTVLSLTVSQSKVQPQAAEPTNDRLAAETGMAVFTVEYPEGDTTNFYLKSESGYLTTGATGNSLSYAETPNDYSLWYLAPAESENCVYVYSTNAAYNGTKNQAMEFYSGGFTVYGLKDTSNKAIFTFQLYVNAQHTHSWVLTQTVAPTCTEGGYEIWTCSVCGETRQENETAALGHAFGDWTAAPAPTCTETGTELRTCSRCGLEETRTLEALGHAYEAVVTAPTCTEQGYTTYTCSRCGDSRTDDETEALGHAWDEGVVTLAPTTEAEGVRTYTCSRCGQTRTEAIPRLEETAFRFDDVRNENQYYFVPVYWAYEHDPRITTGMTETLFRPNYGCTRAHVVTFLWRAAGCPEPELTSCSFRDVEESAYYYKAVLWAVENGIATGTTSTTFSPERACTRAQTVTFLWRFAGSPAPAEETLPFTDVRANAYYRQAVLWAWQNQITSGTSDTTFSPNVTCSRGHAVTFLYRIMNEIS